MGQTVGRADVAWRRTGVRDLAPGPGSRWPDHRAWGSGARSSRHAPQLRQTRPAPYVPSTVSTVSASSARLSSRWRSTRAKRSVTPAG